jgi:hypothetical protein
LSVLYNLCSKKLCENLQGIEPPQQIISTRRKTGKAGTDQDGKTTWHNIPLPQFQALPPFMRRLCFALLGTILAASVINLSSVLSKPPYRSFPAVLGIATPDKLLQMGKNKNSPSIGKQRQRFFEPYPPAASNSQTPLKSPKIPPPLFNGFGIGNIYRRGVPWPRHMLPQNHSEKQTNSLLYITEVLFAAGDKQTNTPLY